VPTSPPVPKVPPVSSKEPPVSVSSAPPVSKKELPPVPTAPPVPLEPPVPKAPVVPPVSVTELSDELPQFIPKTPAASKPQVRKNRFCRRKPLPIIIISFQFFLRIDFPPP